MESVRLMNRVDTKYLTVEPVVDEILRLAADGFLIQEINGIRQPRYHSTYFDTPDARMYYDHQRGKKSRRKVRIRKYLDSDTPPFLEVKDKNNKGRTKKHRVAMNEGSDIRAFEIFITQNSEFSTSSLIPHIENTFRRITLVNIEKTERITIDTSLEFNNFVSGQKIELPGLAVIEWKRDALAANSLLKHILNSLRIHQSGFSKYCIGMALSNPLLKNNRIKPRLRLVDKILFNNG